MSLLRPQDQFSGIQTYGNPKLYALTRTSNSSVPSPIFDSGNRKIVYSTESYSSESYDPKYFIDSPIEDEEFHSSISVTDSRANTIVQNPYDSYQPMESQNPDDVHYNEDELQLKLHELERALLDEEDDEESMEIEEGQWSNPKESPKESSSSDSSNLSSSISSSCKEISLTSSPHTPKQCLLACAAMISDGNIDEASAVINDLRQRVSIQGEPSDRIAAYMVEALAARVATSGKGLYKALRCKEAPSNDRLSAMQVLFEVCPCFRFGFMAANGAIIEALKDEKTVHIIDFDINQGSQYITLIQTLANLPGKPPHLRLTGVDDPESVQRPVGGLIIIGQRLEELASQLNVSFEFKPVAANTAAITPAMLGCRNGEAVIINFAFQLHHMPDESVSTENQRDQLLRMVKGLNPKLVTVVEQDVNTNTMPFLPRFVEAYNYYAAVFDSLEAAMPRDSQDRLNVEKQCLARDIVNIVACEGEERIERYEVAGKWRARLMMAGFSPSPISLNVRENITNLIQQYSDRYKVKDEAGALHFGWEDKVLVVASAWR